MPLQGYREVWLHIHSLGLSCFFGCDVTAAKQTVADRRRNYDSDTSRLKTKTVEVNFVPFNLKSASITTFLNQILSKMNSIKP